MMGRYQIAGVLMALTAGLVLSACGSTAETQGSEAPEPPSADDAATTEPAISVCDNSDQITEYANRVDPQLLMTSTSLGTDLKAAHEFFSQNEAPEKVAANDWGQVSDFLGELVDAYGDVGKPTSESIAAGAAALGEEAMGRAEQALIASKAIIDDLKEACGEGASGETLSSASELCEILSESDLVKVFGEVPIPEPEPGSFGAGHYECEWEFDAEPMHDDDFQVTMIVVPAKDLQTEYLDKMESLGEIAEFDNGQILPGTVLLIGGNSRGHSVTFSVGDLGGIVGVQKGQDAAQATEVGLATDLAKKVVSQLG